MVNMCIGFSTEDFDIVQSWEWELLQGYSRRLFGWLAQVIFEKVRRNLIKRRSARQRRGTTTPVKVLLYSWACYNLQHTLLEKVTGEDILL